MSLPSPFWEPSLPDVIITSYGSKQNTSFHSLLSRPLSFYGTGKKKTTHTQKKNPTIHTHTNSSPKPHMSCGPPQISTVYLHSGNKIQLCKENSQLGSCTDAHTTSITCQEKRGERVLVQWSLHLFCGHKWRKGGQKNKWDGKSDFQLTVAFVPKRDSCWLSSTLVLSIDFDLNLLPSKVYMYVQNMFIHVNSQSLYVCHPAGRIRPQVKFWGPWNGAAYQSTGPEEFILVKTGLAFLWGWLRLPSYMHFPRGRSHWTQWDFGVDLDRVMLGGNCFSDRFGRGAQGPIPVDFYSVPP